MVWKSTKKLGVGKATASDGSSFVVARYFPAGNITNQGHFENNVLPAKASAWGQEVKRRSHFKGSRRHSFFWLFWFDPLRRLLSACNAVEETQDGSVSGLMEKSHGFLSRFLILESVKIVFMWKWLIIKSTWLLWCFNKALLAFQLYSMFDFSFGLPATIFPLVWVLLSLLLLLNLNT